MRHVGVFAVAAGVGLLAYVAWMLWGTGMATADVQRALADEWQHRDPTVAVPADRSPKPLARGVAQLTLPSKVANRPLIVVGGITDQALQRGPGRYPNSEPPGQAGNYAIAGHRTTYGAPFGRLDALTQGDPIRLTDATGRRWRYKVAAVRVVDPTQTDVVADDPLGVQAPTLTLTTCHPRFSARQRLIVHAVLDQSAAAHS